MRYALLAFLFIHGVAHLAAFQILGGRVALGFWLALAIGFIGIIPAVWTRVEWWLPAVSILVVASLVACLIWWKQARWGVAANLMVLALASLYVRYPGTKTAVRCDALDHLWAQARSPAVYLQMEGRIKLGAWHSFIAEQVIDSHRGMVWAANVSMYGLPVIGSDAVVDGNGRMVWKLFGLIPVADAAGPDVSRSAEGRMVGEMAAWLPGAHPPRWAAQDIAVRMDVNSVGEIAAISFPRWGNPSGGPFRTERFGVSVKAMRNLGGRTIPGVFRAGWYFGEDRFETDGCFFEATLTEASYR